MDTNNYQEESEEKLEGEVGLEMSDNNDSCQNDFADDIYPIAEVKIEKAQFSISEIQKHVTERKTLIIEPDFQRNKVWNPKQKCELVESILMGIPIPIMYLFEQKDGKRQVVDGRQRITTIIEFLNNDFPLKNLKILRGSNFNNCYFKDLDPKYQIRFEDYQLFFYIIQPPTAERIKYDIFDRVNRGGTRLNNQEMRNALYQGKATTLLKDLSESQQFQIATGYGIKPERMKDRYVILRLISFYMLRNNWFEGNSISYKGDLEDFLAKCMIYINEKMSNEKINNIKNIFINAMEKIHCIVGDDAFRFNRRKNDSQRRPINMLLFEALGYMFMAAEENSEDLSLLDFNRIKNDFDYSNLFDGKNDTEARINERYNFILYQMIL